MDYQSLTPVDGFFFNQAHGGMDRAKSVVMDLLAINAGLVDSYFTVFGFGEPLFEHAEFLSAAGAPDVWVTWTQTWTLLGCGPPSPGSAGQTPRASAPLSPRSLIHESGQLPRRSSTAGTGISIYIQ